MSQELRWFSALIRCCGGSSPQQTGQLTWTAHAVAWIKEEEVTWSLIIPSLAHCRKSDECEVLLSSSSLLLSSSCLLRRCSLSRPWVLASAIISSLLLSSSSWLSRLHTQGTNHTLHTTHSTLHTSHHTLHTTHLAPHTSHHTPHTTHSTPYTLHHTLHAIPHLTCYGTCRLWRWSCEEVSGDVVRVRHETCAWLGEGSVASATQESGTSLCGNVAVSSTHHMPCGPHCTTHLLFPLLDFLQ